MAAKKRTVRKRTTTKATKPAHGSKSAFVRANSGMPAGDLVALGAKQGIKLSAGFIYNIRAADKRRRNGNRTPAAADRGAARPGDMDAMESRLRTLILRMGFDGADAVFTDLRARMKALTA